MLLPVEKPKAWAGVDMTLAMMQEMQMMHRREVLNQLKRLLLVFPDTPAGCWSNRVLTPALPWPRFQQLAATALQLLLFFYPELVE